MLEQPSADIPATYRLPATLRSNEADPAELDRFVGLLVARAAASGIDLRARSFEALPRWVGFRLRTWDGASAEQVLASLSSVLSDPDAPEGASIGIEYPWNTSEPSQGMVSWPRRLLGYLSRGTRNRI